MVKYAKPDKIVRFELPSTPGAEVWGPGRLGYRAVSEINSKAMRIHVEGFDEEGNPNLIPIFDPHLMQYEMVKQFLTHKDADWNLMDEKDQPLKRTMDVIDHVLDPDDMVWLGQQLNEALGGQVERDASAEGEPKRPSEKPSSGRSAAAKGSS